MNFEEILKELTERAAGLAAIIMGRDGIAVGSYTSPDFPYSIEEIGIEHVSLIKGFEETEGLKNLGPLKELALLTDSFKLLLMSINQDYFLILAADRGTYTGKARFALRRAVERLKREF